MWHTGIVSYLLRTLLKFRVRLPLGQTQLPSARMLRGLAWVLVVLAGVEASTAWQPPAPALRPLHPARAMWMRGAGAAPLRGGGVLMGKAGFQGERSWLAATCSRAAISYDLRTCASLSFLTCVCASSHGQARWKGHHRDRCKQRYRRARPPARPPPPPPPPTLARCWRAVVNFRLLNVATAPALGLGVLVSL